MDEHTRATLKEKILDQIAETEERIINLEKATEAVAPDKALGRLSRLEAMSDKSVNDAALAQARDDLERLEFALSKVLQRDFGICVTCKVPIPEERLLAMPHAAQCVRCASANTG